MKALKRKQNFPLGVEKGMRVVMQTRYGHLLMLGHCIGEYFYTPDLGVDKWEVWDLADLKCAELGFENPKIKEEI